jgi:hypothetical protein
MVSVCPEIATMSVSVRRRVWILFTGVTALFHHHCLPISFSCNALSLSSTSMFHGSPLTTLDRSVTSSSRVNSASSSASSLLTMRKQKASDRRTRRMQRGYDDSQLANERIRDSLSNTVLTQSPMIAAGGWNQRRHASTSPESVAATGRSIVTGGRSRSRKRSLLYRSLSSYHNKFLQLLTTEYRAEVSITKSVVCVMSMPYFSKLE